jgi:hypothetical protein
MVTALNVQFLTSNAQTCIENEMLNVSQDSAETSEESHAV